MKMRSICIIIAFVCIIFGSNFAIAQNAPKLGSILERLAKLEQELAKVKREKQALERVLREEIVSLKGKVRNLEEKNQSLINSADQNSRQIVSLQQQVDAAIKVGQYYRIIVKHNNLYLNVCGHDAFPRYFVNNVQVYPQQSGWMNGDNQKFRLEPAR